MRVSLIFNSPDLFIPIMYTDSDMSIVHANIYVTGFVKTVPIGTTIEIYFMA